MYHIVDDLGNVWAHDIRNKAEAEEILENILKEHPEAADDEIEIICDEEEQSPTNNEDYLMSIDDYYDSLIGGLNDPEEAKNEILEIRQAPIGRIKANCWEKVDENHIIVFVC